MRIRIVCVLIGLFLHSLIGPTYAADAAARVTIVAGAPSPGEPPVAGALREPFAVETDRAGNLLIAELAGERVHRLDAHGRLTRFAGTGVQGYSGDGGPAVKARFHWIHNLAVAPSGDVYLADTWNNCVRKVDAATGRVSTIAGTGQKGFSGDGGPASKAECGGIYCVSMDRPRNRLLLADLDSRRIRVVTLEGGKIATLAGNGRKGVPADGSLACESPLVDPRAVTCDAAGNVYILEREGHSLRCVDPAGHIRTVAGIGRKGPAIAEVSALNATFNGPKHLCTDAHGDVIIADTENHAIRKLLVREERVVLLAGTGKPGTGGIGGPPGKVQLNRPHGVFVDTDGDLYIADSSNHRVLKVAYERKGSE